jgi:hypothetical protein
MGSVSSSRKTEDSFDDAYRATTESVGAAVGSMQADDYVHQVEDAIELAKEQLDQSAADKLNLDTAYLKGFLAEKWHEGTFNIDAARLDQTGYKASALEINRGLGREVDLRITDPHGEVRDWQLKYYNAPNKTAAALSRPDYDGLGKIGPADQIDTGGKDVAYYASRQADRNVLTRPEQADRYRDTAQNAADRARMGDVESRPISDDEMYRIAKDYQRGEELDAEGLGLSTSSVVLWEDILRESGEAAINAAVLTAVLKTSPHLWTVLKQLIEDGKADPEALRSLGLAATQGATQGALRGGVAAAITASCRAGLLGPGLTGIDPTAVGAATAVAMNAIHNAIGVHNGVMSKEEFAEATIRDCFVVSFGVLGASFGQALIPVPVLGAVIGNLIGATAASVVYSATKRTVFAYFIKSGTAFWFIVRQDYKVPREVLARSGFDLVDFDEMGFDQMEFDQMEFDQMDYDRMEIQVLRRGMISVNTIGYLT